jgi:hypothetical protein
MAGYCRGIPTTVPAKRIDMPIGQIIQSEPPRWLNHQDYDRNPHPRRDQYGTALPHRHPLAARLHPQPIAIAALMAQLFRVEVGRRPQIGLTFLRPNPT